MRTPEDAILFACCRLELDQIHRDRITTLAEREQIDWRRLYGAALAHKVAPLVFRNLATCGDLANSIPEPVRRSFQEATWTNALVRSLIAANLTELMKLLADHAHELMVVKGAALDLRIGGTYVHTMASDADVIVRPARQQGRAADPDATWSIIREFRRPRPQLFELFEIDFLQHHDLTWNGLCAIDFERVWRDSIAAGPDATGPRIPCDADLLIFASINASRRPFLRLRSLLDLSALAGLRRDLDWDALARRAIDYRCNTLLYSALTVAKMTVGCDVDTSGLALLRPGALRSVLVPLIARRISPCAIFRLPRSIDRAPSSPPAWAGGQRNLRSFALRVVSMRLIDLLPYGTGVIIRRSRTILSKLDTSLRLRLEHLRGERHRCP